MAVWPLRSPCRELSWEVSSWKEINGSRDGPRILTDKRVQNWCRRGESNPRPRDYETLALPLSYAGVTQFFMLRIRLRTCQGIVAKSRTMNRHWEWHTTRMAESMPDLLLRPIQGA